jgi:hypothetical protein
MRLQTSTEHPTTPQSNNVSKCACLGCNRTVISTMKWCLANLSSHLPNEETSCEFVQPVTSCEFVQPVTSCEFVQPVTSCELVQPVTSYEFVSPSPRWICPSAVSFCFHFPAAEFLVVHFFHFFAERAPHRYFFLKFSVTKTPQHNLLSTESKIQVPSWLKGGW